jgi:hypothetical protein
VNLQLSGWQQLLLEREKEETRENLGRPLEHLATHSLSRE